MRSDEPDQTACNLLLTIMVVFLNFVERSVKFWQFA